MGMETGIVVVEASPTLVGSVALDALELGRLASTANKMVVHSSYTTTLKATALHNYVNVCVCAGVGRGSGGGGGRMEEQRRRENLKRNREENLRHNLDISAAASCFV